MHAICVSAQLLSLPVIKEKMLSLIAISRNEIDLRLTQVNVKVLIVRVLIAENLVAYDCILHYQTVSVFNCMISTAARYTVFHNSPKHCCLHISNI